MAPVPAEQLCVTPALDVEAVYRDQAGFVWTNLRRFGVPPELLEDAVHDVFVVLHRRARQFDPRKATVTTWVFGVVRRIAADHRRSRDRRKRKLDAYAEYRGRDARGQHLRAIPPAELRVLLTDLLTSVDEQAAQIFVLSQLHGMPMHEIADDLGLNRNTAASRLRVTRRRFAELTGERSLHPEQAESAVAALRALEARDPQPIPEGTKRRVMAGLLPIWSVPAAAVSRLKMLVMPVLVLGSFGALVGSLSGEPAASRSANTWGERSPFNRGAFAQRSRTPQPELPELLAPERRTITAPQQRPAQRRAITAGPQRAHASSLHGTPSVPAPVQETAVSGLQDELALVTRARRAVRGGDASLALELHRRHTRQFPSGWLKTEMAVVEIDSLCRLGRSHDAHSRARALPTGTIDNAQMASPCG